MAANLVTVTGNLETLVGATPQLGRLWFKITRPDWNDAGDIFAPEYVEAVAASNGAFSIALQSTADFEAGSVYSAILRYRDAVDGKDREYTVAKFTVPVGGPYQLGDLLTVPIVEPVPADILALAAGYAAAAAASAAAAAVSAAEAEISAGALVGLATREPFTFTTDAAVGAGRGPYALPFDPTDQNYIDLKLNGLGQSQLPGRDYNVVNMPAAPSGKGILFNEDQPSGLICDYVMVRPLEVDPSLSIVAFPTRADAIAAFIPSTVPVLRYNHNGRVRDFVRSTVATGTATNGGAVYWQPQNGAQRNYSQAPTEFRPEIIAHRGFANCGPQNTLISLSRAIRYCDSIEFDIAMSADGTPWVFHDATVDALTNGTGTFIELTDAYISTLLLTGSAFGPEGAEPITKLEDALLLVKQSGVIAYPELKRLRAGYAADIDIVMDMIEAFGVGPQCRIGSFDETHLSYVRSLDPDIGLSLFFSDAANPVVYNAAILFAATIGNCDVSWNVGNVDDVPTGPILAYGAGAPVLGWTVGSAHIAQRTMRSNVNRLFTDHPINARRFR